MKSSPPDELRARFTIWLERTLYRERRRYIQKAEKETISLDDVPESALLVLDEQNDRQREFEFEEERLSKAFAQLSPKRQKILCMLFVEELKPGEVAKMLGASPDSVYKHRYRAICFLREALENRGDE